jgi:SecD/SecF fusion protein
MLKLIGVPQIDWIRKWYLFWGISAAFMIVGVVSLVREGKSMLGIEFSSGTKATIQFREGTILDGKPLKDGSVREHFEKAARKLGFALLADTAKVEEVRNPDGKASTEYQLMTTEDRPAVVRDVAAEAFGGALVQRVACKISPTGSDAPVMGLTMANVPSKDYANWGWAPITTEVARDNSRLRRHVGGVLLAVPNITPGITDAELTDRIRVIRRQPDMKAIVTNQFEVFHQGPADPDRKDAYTSFAVAVTSGGQIADKDLPGMAQEEAKGLSLALTRPEAIPITTFNPAMAGESVQRAIIAIVLSWVGIVAYLWLRFGSWRWGLGAVVSLVHDTIVVVGLVAFSGWLSTNFLGKLLGIDSAFKIDMVMVAAILTLIGYSVNDTIVVFDRIRENRGKLTSITPRLINVSINQTLPRTLLTGVSTLVVVLVMYLTGGAGIHGFNFALLVGILFGTYSSIAIACPLLMGFKMLIMGKVTGQDDTHVNMG